MDTPTRVPKPLPGTSREVPKPLPGIPRESHGRATGLPNSTPESRRLPDPTTAPCQEKMQFGYDRERNSSLFQQSFEPQNEVKASEFAKMDHRKTYHPKEHQHQTSPPSCPRCLPPHKYHVFLGSLENNLNVLGSLCSTIWNHNR
jgi:hypothetical protein